MGTTNQHSKLPQLIATTLLAMAILTTFTVTPLPLITTAHGAISDPNSDASIRSLKNLEKQIADEQKELQRLASKKTSTAKQVAALESRERNLKTLLRNVNNDINWLNHLINKSNKNLQQLDAELSQAKQDLLFANAVLVETVIKSHESPIFLGDAIDSYLMSSETKSIVANNIDAKISIINDKQNKVKQVLQENDKRVASIKQKKSRYQKITKDIVASQQEYAKQISLLSKDEQSKKEYINQLKQSQEILLETIRRGTNKELITKYANPFAELSDSNFIANKGRYPKPVSGSITEPFGERYIEQLKTSIKNNGIKIGVTKDSNVIVIARGIVVYTDYVRGMGNVVIVQHSQNYYTVYAHLDRITVEAGDILEKSSVLGYIFGSGDSTFLHFELRRGQRALNPVSWIK